MQETKKRARKRGKIIGERNAEIRKVRKVCRENEEQKTEGKN